MTPSQAHAAVRATGWLSRQPADFQDRVLAAGELKKVARTESLFNLDDPPGGIYGIAAGSLDVFVSSGPFLPRLGFLARPGWWAGEAAAATGSRRRAQIRARTEVWAVYVPARQLDRLEREDPRFWKRFASLSVEHMDEALMMVSCLSTADIQLRVVGTLARLLDPAEIAHEHIELPINQSDLAELAGLSRNAVARVLAQLRRRGCVQSRYGRMVIDVSRLRSMVHPEI